MSFILWVKGPSSRSHINPIGISLALFSYSKQSLHAVISNATISGNRWERILKFMNRCSKKQSFVTSPRTQGHHLHLYREWVQHCLSLWIQFGDGVSDKDIYKEHPPSPYAGLLGPGSGNAFRAKKGRSTPFSRWSRLIVPSLPAEKGTLP